MKTNKIQQTLKKEENLIFHVTTSLDTKSCVNKKIYKAYKKDIAHSKGEKNQQKLPEKDQMASIQDKDFKTTALKLLK